MFYVPSSSLLQWSLFSRQTYTSAAAALPLQGVASEEQRRHHGMPKAAVGDTLQRTGAFGTRPLAQRAGTLWAWWARRAFLGSGRCGRARTRQSSSGRFRSTSLCPILPAAAPAVLVPVVTTGGCLQHDACTNAWPPCPACTRGGVRTCSDTPVRYNPFGITSS